MNTNVGFVLVCLIENVAVWHYSIAEFFILKKYRREGIGKAVEAEIFSQHKGPWEVHQIENNTGAQSLLKRFNELIHLVDSLEDR